MKYKNGDIVRVKNGEDTLKELNNACILVHARELLGERVEIVGFIDRGGRHNSYSVNHKHTSWSIPENCIEPAVITNWRGEFEK